MEIIPRTHAASYSCSLNPPLAACGSNVFLDSNVADPPLPASWDPVGSVESWEGIGGEV